MHPLPFFRMNAKALLLALVSAAYPLSSLGAAGKVEFSIGNVTLTGADGRTRALSKGTEIDTGDTILTGEGRAQLRFTDGGYISLTPNTEFRVDDYHYEGHTDGNEKSFFNLVKGGLRAVTGAIGKVNKKNYLVNTPVATIGIRGTEFLATMTNRLIIKVGDGAIYITNAAGDLVLYKGQSGEVGGPGQKPQYTTDEPQVNAAGPEGGTPQETLQEEEAEQFTTYNYSTGTDTTAAGDPCVVTANCSTLVPASSEILTLTVAHIDSDDGGSTYAPQIEVQAPLTIVTDGSGRPVKFFNSEWSAAARPDVTIDNLGSYSTLSWARWRGGTVDTLDAGVTSADPLEAAHIVYGPLTSGTEMQNLVANNLTGTYSLVGYTTPTGTAYSAGASTFEVTGAVTGSLTAFFGTGNVSLDLSADGGFYSVSGATGPIAGPLFAATSTSALMGASLGTFFAAGFFSGPQAANAGISYEFDDGSFVVEGAAVLKQDSLTP